MLHVEILRGLPASGKSTFAKEQDKNSSGEWKRINRDDLRNMVDAGEWSPQMEKVIVASRNALLEVYLRKGFNVIIDDTNLRDENWTEINDIVAKINLDVQVVEKCFPIDVATAVERDSKRLVRASVGEKVITNMWKKNIRNHPETMRPRVLHHFQRQLPGITQNSTLQKAVICDLDGTLAVIGDRSPYNASKCDEVDLPNASVVETVRLFHKEGYKILFVSGREDKDRDPTMRFIVKHLPEVCGVWLHGHVNRLTNAYKRLTPSKVEEKGMLALELDEVANTLLKVPMDAQGCELIMRVTDDKRKDTLVKHEIFEKYIKDKYNVLCVIDDRPSVCRMWRYEIGLPVFQVNDKEF